MEERVGSNEAPKVNVCHAVLALSIALCSACTGALAGGTFNNPFTPQTAPILHVGLNAWPEELTPEYLDKFVALGANTLRVPVQSRGQAEDVFHAIEGWPLSVLLLIEKPDLTLVGALADLKHSKLAGIELGNELDLAGLSAHDFSVWTSSAYFALKKGGWTAPILSGGIYTVDRDSLAYWKAALNQAPPDLIMALHWYGDASDDLLSAVQQFGRQIAITEFGQPSRTPQEDRAQAIYLTDQVAAFRRLGAQWAIAYQCCDGPTTSNLDRFGLLRSDLSLKGFTFP